MYVCGLSGMKMLASKERNELHEEALKFRFFIVTTEMEIEIPALVSLQNAHFSH